MQRYHATNCGGAVNNSSIGGASVRDTRSDSSSLPANFSLNPRRVSQLAPYRLKCDKEPLNSRLGPPDFHPQTPNCPEETLTREYVQNGYKEIVEGLEEVREISLTQLRDFTKPVVLKCREAIKKCHRAINESRAQKRKAGQVYGVPLSGSLLTKPGVFPEQRPSGEDFRKKWIEGLSQQHKRLRLLADHVPHGYRKKFLIEVLIRNNVPLLRATWFIKVTYLNQVRPASANISSGAPDKSQLSRTELWTKDVIEYLQYLLDELFSRNNSHSAQHNRERSLQMPYAGSAQQRNDLATFHDSEEPSLHFKWWYMVRLVIWHHTEGLLLPSLIIDWILNQLKEKELLEILQLLLPIVYGFLETIVLSQTCVRTLVGITLRFICETSPGGSDLVDNSRRAYTTSALAEMLRYLILAVPDTFVALDCFPLPPCVESYSISDGNFVSKVSEDAGKMKTGSTDAACVFKGKGVDTRYQSLSFDYVVSAIRKRADTLAKGASPGYPGRSVAKAVQALDKALLQGDIRGAYKHLFEDLCDGVVDERWIAEVSPCLRSSLKWVGTVSLSFVCSVFFLCEWATCDFRDFRSARPHDLKFTGGNDFSHIYMAIRILKLMIRELRTPARRKKRGAGSLAKVFNQQNAYAGRNFMANGFESKSCTKHLDDMNINSSGIFESPGPLHDIIVCWIDQHEVHKGEGVKRLQHFVFELIRAGIFYPQAYVRQLIISGILDMSGLVVDTERKRRHHRILKQLPGQFLSDALEEAGVAEGSQLSDAMDIYSNERRLVLHELLCDRSSIANVSAEKQKYCLAREREGSSPFSSDQRKTLQPCISAASSKSVQNDADIEELKTSISVLLQLPSSPTTSADSGLDESQGSVKRGLSSVSSKIDPSDGTPGCEDCKRAKRQKLSEERSLFLQIPSPIQSDEEDMWWVRKGPKPIEPLKVDPPLKPTKQVSRGRQKTVRRTQSLAHLAAARIEGSQGASTSHVCDNKVSCPHHRNGAEGETIQSTDGIRRNPYKDVLSTGKALKRLRFVEKRNVTVWLISVVRQHIEDAEKTVAKAGQFGRPFIPVDDKSSMRWRLREDELSAILYFMDVCNDSVSAAKFLLWLLPKVLNGPSPTIHSGRNVLMHSKNVENNGCDVGEAFILSSLRRYENILIATDILPDALSATMHRAAAVVASSGRTPGSAAYFYARYLLRKYGNVASVVEWEKKFKATCDKRILSELESGRSLDGDLGFPLGVPAGVEDLDDYLRQKITGGRLSRVGLSMRDVVQRHFDDAFHYFCEKERKLLNAGLPKSHVIEKFDDEGQIAQQVIIGLMDCIRQTGGAAQEGDPSLVSSAVSAIVGNVGPMMAKMHDFAAGGNYQNIPSVTGSLSFIRRFFRIHITCLCLLKEALGERQSRVFEIALAAEASSALAGVLSPGKGSRNQFQMSPESHDFNAKISSETLSNSAKVYGKATKIVAAISSLVVGAVVRGVTSLERMVTVFRLKEGLDVMHLVRNAKSSSNGNARSLGAFKVDSSTEVYVHWFRLLIGNCRTVSDGLVVELLGEPFVVALSRMQRMLPLSLVLPPAYSIFAFVIWRPYILSGSLANREDVHQLYQSLTMAINDAIRHLPFRDVCLRDSQGFYDVVAADTTDAEFAAMLELNGLDMHLKSMAFVPLRARLFLNAIIDCKLTHSKLKQEDGVRVSGHGESKRQHPEDGTKLLDRLVHVLDALQPAKFHWQWVELRLLLNEQALVEKLENHDMPLADAIRSSSPSAEKAAASENENNFIEILLTRLLVRPDAAPLFSELVHLFGRSLEDSMLLQAKWFLGGQDVLLGRKTIRQRLINIAESKGLSTKAQFWRPWGWSNCGADLALHRGDKKKVEITSLEEGEVVEENMDSKRYSKGSTHVNDAEGTNVSQQQVTERALVELVLPCIDQSSDDSRNTFASDLIKQLNNIEQQINAVTRGASKVAGPASSGIEGPTSKGNNRKSVRGGSPGLARRSASTADSARPSPAALRASMSLRLQFLLRLLPIIYADGEPSRRNMRHMLASVILRLLGNRIVHEDADLSFYPIQSSQTKREVESPSPESASVPFLDLSGGSLFDRLLLILHGLLSSYQPSWLRSKPALRSSNNSSKDSFGFDREVVESLQNDLDHMQLPDMIRWRIQAAMPILLPSIRCSLSCQPPSVPAAALASLQPSIAISGLYPGNANPTQKNPVPLARTAANTGKSKSLPIQQDHDMEVDPWTLLEDGAGSGPSSSTTAVLGSGDHANLRAASWLKGAVRVRRSDLTYIGSVDDDS